MILPLKHLFPMPSIKNDWRMQKETVTFDNVAQSGRLPDRTGHRIEKDSRGIPTIAI